MNACINIVSVWRDLVVVHSRWYTALIGKAGHIFVFLLSEELIGVH